MKRLELSDGKAHKFWQVEQDGSDLHLRWGRIGTDGQAKTKSFDSAEAAQKDAEKQIRSKLKKGYAEVAASASAEVSTETVKEPSSKAPATKAKVKPVASAKKTEKKKAENKRKVEPAKVSAPESPAESETSAPAATTELPGEDSIFWPNGLLKRVQARRDRPLPGKAPKKPTLRAVYRNLQKTWPPSAWWAEPLLPQAFKAHMSSLLNENQTQLALETPAPSHVERQATALLLLRLKLQAQHRDSHDTPSRHLVDFWVVGSGLDFAMEATCKALLGDLEARPALAAEWRGEHAGMVRWGTGGFDRLRLHLAAASEEEHAAALKIAEDCWPQLGPHQQALLSYLFPMRQDWLEACLEAGQEDPMVMHVMLATVGTGEQLERTDPDSLIRNVGTGMLPTLAFTLGDEAAPFFARWLRTCSESWGKSKDIKKLAALTAIFPHEEALSALLIGLEEKDVYPALQDAANRFSLRLLRLLAPELSKRGATTQRAEILAKGILARIPQALDLCDESTRSQLQNIAEPTVESDEADADDLPRLLREPPWQRRPELPKAKAISLEMLSEPRRMDWAAGEQRRFSQILPLSERYADSRIVDGLLELDTESVAESLSELIAWQITDVAHNLPRLIAKHELSYLPIILELDDAQLIPRAAASIAPFDCIELAQPVAEWFDRNQNARARARHWLLTRSETAAAGLLPAAVGKDGKAKTAAVAALRALAHNGQADAIEKAITRYADQASEADLRKALATVFEVEPIFILPKKMPELPTFVDITTLPAPTLRDGRALPSEAVQNLLSMLAISSPTDAYAGLAEVKEACDERSLEIFADGLYDAWTMAGADLKQKWAFFALGHLGGDATARKLEPLIRQWAKGGSRPRAMMGLEVLGLIGSDMSLMLLHGISQKASKGLQQTAQEAIERIAAGRSLSPDQLADRLVPNLGLSPDGSLKLDYGPRHFTVAFDEQLKPFVIDESGKKRKTAPKPGASDDESAAAVAYDRWSELKKAARKVAKGQIERLERAMCEDRRWSIKDFEARLAGHPLLVHLVRRLLWGVYNDEGELKAGFRVDADGSYATITDEPFDLGALDENASIGLAHRLELADDVVAAWREQWADYELVSPFPQLDRDIYRPSDEEKAVLELKRFEGSEVPGSRVLGLERWGWRKGEIMDGGLFSWMLRPFGNGEHEIVLLFDPGIPIGDPSGFEPPVLSDVVIWQAGVQDAKPAMAFGKLPPRIFSELVRDIEELRRPR